MQLIFSFEQLEPMAFEICSSQAKKNNNKKQKQTGQNKKRATSFHSTSRLSCWLRPTKKRDARSLEGFLQKKTPHGCRVPSVLCSEACSDSAYVGHHLPHPLLMSTLAKSRSHTERASTPECRPLLRPPPTPSPPKKPLMWTPTLKALVRIAPVNEEARTLRLRSP